MFVNIINKINVMQYFTNFALASFYFGRSNIIIIIILLLWHLIQVIPLQTAIRKIS